MNIIINLILFLISLSLFAAEPAPKRQKLNSGQSANCNVNLSFKDLILQGHLLEVKKLLKEDPTLINYKEEHGYTPLILAIRSNNLPMFMEISNISQDFNEKDIDGNTALFYVAKFNSGINGIIFAKTLLQKGATLNTQNKDNLTPLMLASAYARPEIVKLFLENDFYNNPANVNLKEINGKTPLIFAIEQFPILKTNINDVKEVIKALINKGADINLGSNRNSTPLMFAINQRKIALVNFLIELGANVNLVVNVAKRGLYTPITYAINEHERYNINKEIKNKILEIIELLIAKGANLINVVDNANPGQYIISLSPLLYAAKLGDYEVVRLLFEKGVQGKEIALNLVWAEYTKKFNILNKTKKENYLKTIGYLSDPYLYVAQQGSVEQAKNILRQKIELPVALPNDVTDIIGEYITGSYNGDDNFINAFKHSIHSNKFEVFIEIFKNNPDLLMIKNSLEETPLIVVVKEQDPQIVSSIINLLKDLPEMEIQRLNLKEKAIRDLGVPNEIQEQKLNEIDLEKRTFDNKFHAQLKEALVLANKMPSQEVKAILQQYAQAFKI